MPHQINTYNQTVQFEDVDAAGIVHHPMYLYYLERARCQNLMDNGCSIKKILDEKLGIVVASAEMKFLSPLHLHEQVIIATQVDSMDGPVVRITQAIVSDASHLPKGQLKDELRDIKSLRFFAHLKLVIISAETKKAIAPPDWLLGPLSA